MAVRRLIDTNIYSAMRRGDGSVRRLIHRSDELLLSTIVLGELLHGFALGAQPQSNRRELDEFVGSVFVRLIEVTPTTSDRYARIATALRRKGRPIPSNDIWIAAHAMEAGADLVSYDTHFAAVDGLVWLNPGDEPSE